MLPKPIQTFIEVFSQIPAIGPRQATRMAFYFLGLGKASIKELSDAVAGLGFLEACPECFFPSDKGSCVFCANPQRDKKFLALVERPTDVIAFERTQKFNGIYLVLGELGKTGMLQPDQKLKLRSLGARGPFREIILAFDQTTYADFNASLIEKEVRGAAEKITRLGRGIPTGGEIEFADSETLGGALQNRR